MLRFAEAGYKVLGFDIDPGKISMLTAGRATSSIFLRKLLQLQFITISSPGLPTLAGR